MLGGGWAGGAAAQASGGRAAMIGRSRYSGDWAVAARPLGQPHVLDALVPTPRFGPLAHPPAIHPSARMLIARFPPAHRPLGIRSRFRESSGRRHGAPCRLPALCRSAKARRVLAPRTFPCGCRTSALGAEFGYGADSRDAIRGVASSGIGSSAELGATPPPSHALSGSAGRAQSCMPATGRAAPPEPRSSVHRRFALDGPGWCAVRECQAGLPPSRGKSRDDDHPSEPQGGGGGGGRFDSLNDDAPPARGRAP